MKVIAVIPSLGERTEGIAVERVKAQVSAVTVLQGLERAESIELAWEISQDYDYMVWTPTDLLIKPGVVDMLLEELIKSGKDRIVSKCISKFRGLTVGGITIQKTHKNKSLIKCVQENADNLRPESSTALQILTNTKSNINAGFHEYFLDYSEIYDRYIHQAKKHKSQVRNLIGTWERKTKDKDYVAAIRGVQGLPLALSSKGPITAQELSEIKKYYV